jgi:hypothetical protein
MSNSGLTVWFQSDVSHILAAVVVAATPLMPNERLLLAAVAAGFGLDFNQIVTAAQRQMVAGRCELVSADYRKEVKE